MHVEQREPDPEREHDEHAAAAVRDHDVGGGVPVGLVHDDEEEQDEQRPEAQRGSGQGAHEEAGRLRGGARLEKRAHGEAHRHHAQRNVAEAEHSSAGVAAAEEHEHAAH